MQVRYIYDAPSAPISKRQVDQAISQVVRNLRDFDGPALDALERRGRVPTDIRIVARHDRGGISFGGRVIMNDDPAPRSSVSIVSSPEHAAALLRCDPIRRAKLLRAVLPAFPACALLDDTSQP